MNRKGVQRTGSVVVSKSDKRFRFVYHKCFLVVDVGPDIQNESTYPFEDGFPLRYHNSRGAMIRMRVDECASDGNQSISMPQRQIDAVSYTFLSHPLQSPTPTYP